MTGAFDQPTRARDTAVYQRIAIALHVFFLAAALLTFALVGEVNAPVIALAVGALVFAGWTVYMLRAEAAARHDDAMTQTAQRRNHIDRTFASERPPAGPVSVVPSATGSTVVAAAPGSSNPIRPPDVPGPYTELNGD